MMYKVYRLHISLQCKPYDQLHKEMRSIISEYIIKELSVDLTDVLFEVDHQLRYNSFTHRIQYTLCRDASIDEKIHHKLMLLNSDYIHSNRVSAWNLSRAEKEAGFHLSVDEYDEYDE